MAATHSLPKRLIAASLKLANAVAAASGVVAPGLIDGLAERARGAGRGGDRPRVKRLDGDPTGAEEQTSG